MCVTIIYDGRRMDSMREARRYLGDANVVISGDYTVDIIDGNNCLCPVDIRKTAERLGRKLEQPAEEGGDPMEVAFIREP